MNLLSPLPGDDQRAEDICEELHAIFTRTMTRLRFNQRAFTIDGHPGIQHRRGPLGWLGIWTTLAIFNEQTSRWNYTEVDPDKGKAIVMAMLDVMRRQKAHLVYDTARHCWVVCIANEFNEYRGIGEIQQIRPKYIDWRPIHARTGALIG